VIGWLLVWALADTTFPAEAPGAPEILSWLAAVATVCLFSAGLLAHELAHSLVAVRLVVDATGRVIGLITLRQLKGIPPSRRTELHVSEMSWPVEQVPSAAPDDPVLELVDRVASATAGNGRALVFDDGRLVGILSPTDLNHALELARLREGARSSHSAGRSALDHPTGWGSPSDRGS